MISFFVVAVVVVVVVVIIFSLASQTSLHFNYIEIGLIVAPKACARLISP